MHVVECIGKLAQVLSITNQAATVSCVMLWYKCIAECTLDTTAGVCCFKSEKQWFVLCFAGVSSIGRDAKVLVDMRSIAYCTGEHIIGEPIEETPFQFIPARAAMQVYGCGVLISVGAALCFGSRQRRHLQSTRAEGSSSQFICHANSDSRPEQALLQPLLPESSV